jgi:hypothetical protein
VAVYPGGILFLTLGPLDDDEAGPLRTKNQSRRILERLREWGRVLGDGLGDIQEAGDTEDEYRRQFDEARSRLTRRLNLVGQPVLLLIDDAWQAAHVEPFRIGDETCPMVVTTRITKVAEEYPPDCEYALGLLTLNESLELLAVLAETVVKRHQRECEDLSKELEYLPLALKIAGRLLHVEEQRHGPSNVGRLIFELRDGKRLIRERAPGYSEDLASPTGQTVAAVVERSLRSLNSDESRERFARLGGFAAAPYSFDLRAIRAVWETEDVRETLDELIGQGLLEPAGKGRYKMHALLVAYARDQWSQY